MCCDVEGLGECFAAVLSRGIEMYFVLFCLVFFILFVLCGRVRQVRFYIDLQC